MNRQLQQQYFKCQEFQNISKCVRSASEVLLQMESIMAKIKNSWKAGAACVHIQMSDQRRWVRKCIFAALSASLLAISLDSNLLSLLPCSS